MPIPTTTMPPLDTLSIHNRVTQATEEKGEAKEAKESGNRLQVRATTVASQGTRALIAIGQVVVVVHTKEKAAKVAKVEMVPRQQWWRGMVHK